MTLPEKQKRMDTGLSSGTVREGEVCVSFLLLLYTTLKYSVSTDEGSYFEMVTPPKPSRMSEDEQLANAVAESFDQAMEQKYSEIEEEKA